MITHLEDARVHCVVLKVRAVPSPPPAPPATEKVLRKVTAEAASGIRRLGKDEKIDYEAEMKADYDHKELSEDGFTPKHLD